MAMMQPCAQEKEAAPLLLFRVPLQRRERDGGCMASGAIRKLSLLPLLVSLVTMASAQSFRVQCPTNTITHPSNLTNVNAEPPYAGPTAFTTVPVSGTTGGYLVPSSNVNGAIKCQQVSGGDGYSTMADGTQTFMFSFGPLSGLADIANGKPGTQFPSIFNTTAPAIPVPGDPATSDGAMDSPYSVGNVNTSTPTFIWNGAVGLAYDIASLVSIYDIAQDPTTSATPHRVTVQTNSPLG